ncbi:unnamed protein product [Cylicostephanus goldi]|uniref:Uncharacterized protein n=1 Tax=Cylicostephanus goldi TaxID=71465 RepID=A0A3P7MPF0_CYLGO|nr:unnamed protein product [Cylicostephanus goldi]
MCICDARLVACWKRWGVTPGSSLPPLKKKCVKITHFGYWWMKNDMGVNRTGSHYFAPWDVEWGKKRYSDYFNHTWTKPPTTDYFEEGASHDRYDFDDNAVG